MLDRFWRVSTTRTVRTIITTLMRHNGPNTGGQDMKSV